MVERMLEEAKKVRQNAYAPYSNFYVGACLTTESGAFYSGCNVECASYGLTVCAEVSAVSAMVAHGEKRIKAVLVVGGGAEMITPCGACRQVIREFALPQTPFYLCDEKDVKKIMKLEELLPFSFGPNFLQK